MSLLDSSCGARKLEAEIILEYDDAKTAEAIAKAVSPDNFKTPKGLSIKTMSCDKKVVTTISNEEKMATFIATIDDLLFCIATAERALQTAKKLNK
jgi:tRNA threonylcarbamoyladenosine modification (KEOPS) complex  Pcc1 subunit